MALMRCQVVIPFETNIPTDVITNTFWFDRNEGATFEEDAENVALGLQDFYSAVYVLGHAVYINTNTCYMNCYDMSTPPPHVPYRVAMSPGIDFGTATAVQCPTEVACVLSFEGAPQNGIPQARRRGRIYIGGVGTGAQITGASASAPYFPVWQTAFLTDITDAATVLATAYNVANGLTWVVYSPTAMMATPVTQGWVDNTPDTQRRRGVKATVRDLWSA
uniref:Uncharacterized protein n=1 Tax=uncultured prokaryote TaxID=198431 RepID=A0A0H5Q5C6_9ZZZZ|nr:hypothetical protein [uncultured prokaryote]